MNSKLFKLMINGYQVDLKVPLWKYWECVNFYQISDLENSYLVGLKQQEWIKLKK